MVRMDGVVVLCRSCYARLRPKTGVVAAGLFQKELRWVIDGKMLRQLRIDAGISQRDFALLIGVSSARVHQIEEHSRSVSDEQKIRIEEALKRCGVKIIGE
jgi:DNA-binding XRE family transcriptional regulator